MNIFNRFATRLLPILLVSSLPAWTIQAFAESAPAGERFYFHTAVQGDTLLKLAHRYLNRVADWPAIARLNRIADPRRIPVGTVVKIPVEMMRTEVVAARVIASGGKAELSGGAPALNMALKEGDTLRTGDDGFVTLQLADGSTLTLQSRSQLRIKSTRQLANTGGVGDHRFGLDHGRLETRVTRQRGPAARYEIETPTSNMGVRGTVFRVGTDGAKVAQTEVTEGRVVAASAGSGAPAVATAVEVGAGFGTIVEAGKPPSAPVALLEPPKLESPAAPFERADIRLPFGAVARAVAYRAQVAADQGFARLIADQKLAGTEASFQDLPDGSLFLRVRGIDERGLEGMDAVARLVVKARPFAPELISPSGARAVGSGTPLTWRANDTAKGYRLHLAHGADFAKPAIDKNIPPGTSFQPDPPLAGGKWFWRMASLGPDGPGPWSPVRSFEVAQPDLNLAPLPDKTGIRIGEGDDKLSYRMQVAEDRRFLRIVQEKEVSGRFEVSGLSPGAYYLRLRAADGVDWSGPWLLEVYLRGWWLSPRGVH